VRRVVIVFVIIPIISLIAVGVALAATERFAAKLTGTQEVPKVVTTAEGNARFTKVSNTQMTFTITASNLQNLSGGHIHLAPRGEEGPIVVDLRVSNTCTVEGTSISCKGAFTSARLEGPLEGRPLGALLRQMRADNTYVNLHTDDGEPPADTGPGDFPGGEIRGQIRAVSTS
jgi:hypothetical protein